MYTPNEVREISFNKAVFGGYDAADVDRVFSSLSDDYATLFKENTMLKKKLKLLADTVEDYRGVDEAMRKALINAQNMASEMVAEAEAKSRDMLETATNEAKAKIGSLMAQIAAEEEKLSRAKAETADFIDSIMKIFDVERDKFMTLRSEVAPAVEAPEAQVNEPMSDTLDEIARSLEEKMRLEEEASFREAQEAAKHEAARPAADEDADMKKVSDTISFENKAPTEEEMDKLEAEAAKPHSRRTRPIFENLKFGADYDVNNED
ncbi:MAG: DivIVA domain-containing protein [Oscillospiraceae bacterium]|nr:DivIVA domain-containing protein [Oscillospiraceae bacterium]